MAAGTTLPVNVVLVCEGEEEIGSPNFRPIVFAPQVEAALRKCVGIIIPLGNQDPDAPDEYWVVEPANAKVAGMDGAARSYVEVFCAVA